MALSVELHSDDGDDSSQIITIVKTAADEATLYKSTSADTGAVASFDLSDVTADVAALRMSCKTNFFFQTIEIELDIVTGAAGQPATVSVKLTPAIFGFSSYALPLRAADVQAAQVFLTNAQFPPSPA